MDSFQFSKTAHLFIIHYQKKHHEREHSQMFSILVRPTSLDCLISFSENSSWKLGKISGFSFLGQEFEKPTAEINFPFHARGLILLPY